MCTADTNAAKTHRIYINPKPRHAVAVYKGLLDREPPIAWSKLADHEILTTCRDALVVYVGGRDALEAVLGILRDYQGQHRDHFLDEVPVMTKPADRLVGVGWAEDLPPIMNGGEVFNHWEGKGEAWQSVHPWITEHGKVVNISHSGWRSIFVLSALRKSAGRDVCALRTELVNIARAARLAPGAMHLCPTIGPELVALVENELFPAVN